MKIGTDRSVAVANSRAVRLWACGTVKVLCMLCAVVAGAVPAHGAVTWRDTGAAPTPLYNGDAVWGAYDNDGGAFTCITSNLSRLKQPSGVSGADVNRDGNLDFLLLGPATKLYVQRADHSGFDKLCFTGSCALGQFSYSTSRVHCD